MSEVTNPHTKKVIPSAKVTGHTHGSGSSAGCGTFHPGGNFEGAEFEVSVDMSFSNQGCIWLRFIDWGFIVGLTIPAGEQSNNATEINQARGNPHQQAAQLLVFGRS